MGAGAKAWGWDETNKVWRPMLVDDQGRMSIKAIVDQLDDIGDVNVAAPTDGYVLYWDNAASEFKLKLISATKLIDADADTKVDVEEAADEDKIRMDVKGVEAFLLHDDGILDLAKQSAIRAYRATSNQTIVKEVWVKVQLNGETFDWQSEFDPATNYRFTAKKAGLYCCTANICYASSAVGRRGISFWKNGAESSTVLFNALSSGSSTHTFSTIMALAATDYVELYGEQETGGNLDIRFGEALTYLAIIKVA